MSLLRRIESARPPEAPAGDGGAPPSVASTRLAAVPGRDGLRDAKTRIQAQVVADLDPRIDLSNQLEVRRQIEEIFNRVLDEEGLALTRAERVRLLEQITDEIIGLGPLEPLLRDESITEIMVNGPRQIYIERAGKLEMTNVVFQNDAT
jgi:pilus assembly protein CpaF